MPQNRDNKPIASPRMALLDFPTAFVVKAFVRKHAEPERLVETIITPHATPERTTSNISKQGQYCAVSVHMTADSQAQLDTIYKALRAHPDVVMTL